MKIYFSQIKEHEVLEYKSLLEDYVDGKDGTLKSINSTKGTIDLNKFDHSLIVKVDVSFDVNVISSYSGDVFKTKINIKDDLFFTDSKSLDSDEFILINDEIDLDNYIYSLLITSIPLNIHKPNEKLPKGDGYRVLTEEEFKKEKEDVSGNAFDALKDIDFGD
jgi:uncharacterized metal-binding protein YceD (DUF177 family)